MLNSSLGQILLANDQPVEALPYFRAAIPNPAASAFDGLLTQDALRRGVEAAGRVNELAEARQWCERALQDAVTRDEGAARVAELLGEIGLLYWEEGNRSDACSKLRLALSTVLGDADATSPEAVAVIVKLGHVLRWVKDLATSGQPPQAAPGGDEFEQPGPGFMLRPVELWAEVPTSAPIDAVLTALGVFAAVVGAFNDAQWALQEAASWARRRRLGVNAGLADSLRATVEVMLGNCREALDAALSGARVMRVSPRATDGPPVDVDAEWARRTPEQRRELEITAVLARVLIPAFVATLDGGRDVAAVVQSLRQTLRERRDDLANYEYLAGAVGYVEAAVLGTMPRTAVIDLIRQLDGTDYGKRLLLLVAATTAPDAAAQEVVSAHAVALQIIVRVTLPSDGAQIRFGRWVIRYWQNHLAERGAGLANAAALRDALERLPQGSPEVAHVADVLLAAQAATGARLSPPLADWLRNLGGGAR